ncbi:MFS transporter [Corynebacterium diphtheriae]|uniref:MFS transporter n=1 Tax=Corynebacterium diphtheriae TaxID=1717 RepID=UPI0015F49A8E|nr:MFS transporter [Corynebacterium diphtheriae]
MFINISMKNCNDSLTPQGRRALLAALLGTIIEWYDYALYGAAAAVVIAPLFFESSAAGGQLAAFATFAVGFVARPLGGVAIGHIGDRFGRRPAMILSVLMMGIATVGIGLLPTEAAIGVLAPVLLVFFRLIQGLGAGAELAGAMTVVAEFAPAAKRGLFTSLVLAMPPAGIVLATAAFMGASSVGDEALLGGVWRIPFLISALLFFIALFMRKRLEETPEYVAAMEERSEQTKHQSLPVVELLKSHKRQVALGFLSITGHNALNYAMAVFAISFMTSDAVGMAKFDALLAVSAGTLVGVVATPLGGLAADRFGADRVLATGSLIGAFYAVPFLLGLQTGDAVIAALTVAFGYGAVISLTSGSQGAFLAGLFQARARFSGIALARETNGALIAGFTPLVLTWILHASGGNVLAAGAVVSASLLVSFVSIMVAMRR